MTPYYSKDGITIYCGNCREYLPYIGVADLCLTDPPYSHQHLDGSGFEGGANFYAGGKLDGMNDFDLGEYEAMFLAVSPMLVAFCSRDLIPDYAELSRTASRKFDLHVWHKTNAIPFTANTWKSDLEYIVLLWDKKPGWKQFAQHEHSKAYISSLCTDRFHPACKPVPLMQKYIKILDAETIVDPFMGSGTTLVAAKSLGRKAVGIDISEACCKMAVERLRQGELFGIREDGNLQSV
jgi:site-specific DNA-methyltransferase (adenine-specific)